MPLVRRPLARSALAALLASVCLVACARDRDERLTELRSLHVNGRYAETVEPLRELLELDPGDAEANYLLGVSLAQTGRSAEAIFPLRKAAESDAYAIEAGILVASALVANQAYEEAVQATDRVIQKDPERFAAWVVRAQAHLAAGDLEAALGDGTQLTQLKPDDVAGNLVRALALTRLERVDEAEQTYEAVQARSKDSGDLVLAARACIQGVGVIQSLRHDAAAAEKKLGTCVKEFPADPAVLLAAAEFYTGLGRPAEGTRLWREATEKAPESLALRFGLAQDLERRGLADESEQILSGLTQDFPSSVEAWKALADFQQRRGAPDRAIASIEKALEIDSQDERLRFMRGDLLAQQGRFDDAEAVVTTLHEGPMRDMLVGSLLYGRQRYAESLEAFGRGLARWPENVGAHLAAGRAALRSGDRERAFAEFRAVLRIDPTNADARLELARLEFQNGSPAEAADLLGPVVQPGVRPDARAQALRLLAEVRLASGDANGARQAALQLRKLPGHEAAGWVAVANVDRAAKGPAAERATLEGSGLDFTAPANLDALRALIQAQLGTGAQKAALALVAKAVAAHPEDAALRDVEGRTLLATGQVDAARAAFERATDLDPKLAAAVTGLATVEAAQGKPDAAIVLYDRAAQLNPLDGSTAYQAAQLVLASGNVEDAERRLRRVVSAFPDQTGAANDLAWILAERGVDLEFALALAERATAAKPDANQLDTLGYVLLKRGEYERAAQAFRRALGQGRAAPGTSYRLGVALKGAGQKDAARTAFETALGAGAFAERGAAESELAALSGSRQEVSQ